MQSAAHESQLLCVPHSMFVHLERFTANEAPYAGCRAAWDRECGSNHNKGHDPCRKEFPGFVLNYIRPCKNRSGSTQIKTAPPNNVVFLRAFSF